MTYTKQKSAGVSPPIEKDLNAHVRMAKIAPGTARLSIALSLVYCGAKIADLNEDI